MLKSVKSRRMLALFVGQMVACLAVCNIMGSSTLRAQAAEAAAPIKIVAFGDSLTAGYMLQPSEAFPVQLEAALRAKGHSVEIVNAGVSGDTTSGGRERLDWSIPEGTEAVIVELGANDALRGIDPKEARASLDAIMSKLKARNMSVLLAGMVAPSNWGEDYRRAFDKMYPELAQEYGALLYPFFLEGVATDPKLNMGDGLHPTAAGVAEIVKRITPKVEELIARVKARRAEG